MRTAFFYQTQEFEIIIYTVDMWWSDSRKINYTRPFFHGVDLFVQHSHSRELSVIQRVYNYCSSSPTLP